MAERMKGRFALGSSVDGLGEGVDTVGPRTGFKDVSHDSIGPGTHHTIL